MGPSMKFAHRVDHVRERVSLAGNYAALELLTAINHPLKHQLEVRRAELVRARRRTKKGGEANAVKAEGNQLVECAAQVKVVPSYGGAG